MPIEIREGLVIPDDELTWTAARSGGPGGQNVNKVNTCVTLYFDVAGSAVLGEAQKRRIQERLATRISRAGVLRVIAREQRTQLANLKAALARMATLLRDALTEAAPRTPTRPGRSAREQRLADKARRARLKRNRAHTNDDA